MVNDKWLMISEKSTQNFDSLENMVIYTDINEIDKNQWQKLVTRSRTATFFQTLECYEFYESLSFMTPFVYGLSEDNNLTAIICGYIISEGNFIGRFFSKRAIVPGGALLDLYVSNEGLKTLLERVKSDLSKKAIYIEIQNYKSYDEYRLVFNSAKYNYISYLNFYVPTYDIPTAFGRLNDELQKQIKLSEKNEIEWRATTDHNEIKAFYAKLKPQYNKMSKTALFPLEFFEKLANLPNGKIFIVKHRRRILGGVACVILEGNTLYEWFSCEDDGKNGYDKNDRINRMLSCSAITWPAIEYAAKTNIYRLEFMNVGRPSDDKKARDYKRKYGGQSVELGRFLTINRPVYYYVGRIALKYVVSKLRR